MERKAAMTKYFNAYPALKHPIQFSLLVLI